MVPYLLEVVLHSYCSAAASKKVKFDNWYRRMSHNCVHSHFLPLPSESDSSADALEEREREREKRKGWSGVAGGAREIEIK